MQQIRKDLVQLIHQTFPDGIVEDTCVPEESYFTDLYSALRGKILKLRGAHLLYEREPNPEVEWADDADPDEDPPLDNGLSSSYHVFFLGLTGKQFRYRTEIEGGPEVEEEWENETSETITGEGTLGCVLAVSVLAPLAAIRFGGLDCYENGSQSQPDLWDGYYSDDWVPIDPEVHIREAFGSQAVRALSNLRKRIATVLESLSITLLPPEEACKPVPWLEAGEDAFVGEAAGRPEITVQDAFFFKGP